MEKYFLDFWNILSPGAAEGRRQADWLENWVREGIAGVEKMSTAFFGIFGLGPRVADSFEYLPVLRKMQEDFARSLFDSFRLFGIVAHEEHRSLLEKLRDAEWKLAAMEEKVRRSEMLDEGMKAREEAVRQMQELAEESMRTNSREIADHFDTLLKKQSEQYNKLMEQLKKESRKSLPTVKAR